MKIALLAAASEETALLESVLARGRRGLLWNAADASDAVARSKANPPDLLLISLGANAAAAPAMVRRIMHEAPTTILLLVRSIDDQPGPIFEALGAGAIDVATLPASIEQADTLLNKLKMLRRLASTHAAHASASQPGNHDQPRRLVVLGASAGGPTALATVLAQLPPKLPAAVIIVQHLDEQFMAEMCRWLGQQCRIDVQLARDGESLQPGVVYLAGRNAHLVLRDRYTLGYENEPADHLYRPSIDELFLSVARYWTTDAVGVLLTGMGKDGAAGLRALRDAGALTISQDRESSVVYGIPKAAARLNAAAEILPLQHIGKRIVEAVESPARRPRN